MDYALTTDMLVKHYGRKTTLQGVSMHVPRTGVYGFLGVNGAGKTTTFGILAGFIKANSGTFVRSGTLSVMPQDARFFRGRKAANQLEFLAALSSVAPQLRKKEALRVLEQVGLADKGHVSPEKMSHGMYKRLGIAQALLGNPDILLLDEPTAGLDPESAFQIRTLVTELAVSKTVVISSHNLHEISEISQTIGIIHEGRMRFEGPLEELTKTGSRVEFHITPSLDPARIGEYPWLLEKTYAADTQVLSVSFDPEQASLEEVNWTISELLHRHQVGVRQIVVGTPLEESFLELVGKKEGV